MINDAISSKRYTAWPDLTSRGDSRHNGPIEAKLILESAASAGCP